MDRHGEGVCPLDCEACVPEPGAGFGSPGWRDRVDATLGVMPRTETSVLATSRVFVDGILTYVSGDVLPPDFVPKVAAASPNADGDVMIAAEPPPAAPGRRSRPGRPEDRMRRGAEDRDSTVAAATPKPRGPRRERVTTEKDASVVPADPTQTPIP